MDVNFLKLPFKVTSLEHHFNRYLIQLRSLSNLEKLDEKNINYLQVTQYNLQQLIWWLKNIALFNW